MRFGSILARVPEAKQLGIWEEMQDSQLSATGLLYVAFLPSLLLG
jgi:hypothetical protein